MISMMSNSSNIEDLLDKAKQEALKLVSETTASSSRESSPSLSPASTASFSYFSKSSNTIETVNSASGPSGIDYGSQQQQQQAKKSSGSKKLNTSRESNESDPRTMDAADTLVSLAHSATSTPTVENKPLLPVTKTNNFEICINANELESKLPADEAKDAAANQQAVESACKLILQQVLKSCPGANLSSITIKTTTQPVTAAPTTTTTTLQIKSNGSTLSLAASEGEPASGAPESSLSSLSSLSSSAALKAAFKTEFVAKTPTSIAKPTTFPHFFYNNNNSSYHNGSNSKRNSSISSLNSLSSQSVMSALSTPSSEDIFTMRNLVCMDEADSEAMPLTPVRPVAKRPMMEMVVGTPSDNVNMTIDNIMNLIKTASEPVQSKLKRPSSISAKMSAGNLLTTASPLMPLKASSPIQPHQPETTAKGKVSKKLAAGGAKSSESRKRPANEDTADAGDTSDSDYDYSDDSSDSINGEIYRKSDGSSTCADKKRARKNDSEDGGRSAAPTLATGRRSKDSELPPDEAKKRQERRERNKEAAARCRRKREELTVTLTKKTEQLSKERDSLRQLVQELAREKSRLEASFAGHEKSCKSSGSKAVTITVSPSTPQQQSAKSGSNSSQNLLRIKKEEINEIIKQSSERKQKPGVQPPTTPQLINSLVSASAAFPGGAMSSLLNTPQSEHHPFSHHAFTNAVLSNLNAQNKQEPAALHSPSKYASSPATVAAINELLAAAVSQHQQQQQQQQQQQSASSNSNSTPPSSTSIQRPSNLNLKSPQSSKLSSSSHVSQSLVHELFASFNAAAAANSSSATPLQLNTPIIFALTPLEATLNTLNAFAATCTTPHLNHLHHSHHQQASAFLTPNSASLTAQHTEQFNALSDAFMMNNNNNNNNSTIYSSNSSNNGNGNSSYK